MNNEDYHDQLSQWGAVVIGDSNAQRKLGTAIFEVAPSLDCKRAQFHEAWGVILEERPNLLFIDIGLLHSAETHKRLRELLTQIKKRFEDSVTIAISISAPEKIAYAGDLLFENQEELEPSEWVDTFLISSTPTARKSISLKEQLSNFFELTVFDEKRRSRGGPRLPALGAAGWVQSIADPQSRELWMRWLPRYAQYTNDNPIIVGRTGTGKTRLAAALHDLSGRTGPFVSITPRDFSSSELIQGELFGAVAGAYTGAVDKWGLVKSAEKGSLFIDELQSIDKELQGKLITFIENKSYRRVGSSETVEADVRFIFATNRSIAEMVEDETLRDDFAYRLERVKLELVPLADRPLDITAALGFALAKIARLRPQTVAIEGISSGAHKLLLCNQWPGNLRQLENVAAKLCERADMREGAIIEERDAYAVLGSGSLNTNAESFSEIITSAGQELAIKALSGSLDNINQGREEFEHILHSRVLDLVQGDTEQAATLLGEPVEKVKLFQDCLAARIS